MFTAKTTKTPSLFPEGVPQMAPTLLGRRDGTVECGREPREKDFERPSGWQPHRHGIAWLLVYETKSLIYARF